MFLLIYGTFKSKNIFFKHSSALTVEYKIGPNLKWPYTEGCLAGWFHGVSNEKPGKKSCGYHLYSALATEWVPGLGRTSLGMAPSSCTHLVS